MRSSSRTALAIGGLLVVGALFAALGAWQLQRAAASRATLAQYAAGADSVPLREPPSALTEQQRFQRLEVTGRYVAERQFLLDNRLHGGAVGYEVLTPFAVQGSVARLLVNRGWVSAGADRGVLPDVGVGGEERRLSGRLERLPRPGLRLGDTAPDDGRLDGVVVVQYPTAAELAANLGTPLRDYQLLLDAAAPDGFVRDWQAPGLGPERHLSYAGQWLLLAVGAAAAAVTIAVRTMRRRQ